MKEQTYPLKINFKCWIETHDNISILGEGKWHLLKMIKEKESLKAAVDHMGYTYRQTWGSLKNIEEKLGFKLVKKSRGGIHGGKTILTPQGEKIVDFFEHLHTHTHQHFINLLNDLLEELNNIPQIADNETENK